VRATRHTSNVDLPPQGVGHSHTETKYGPWRIVQTRNGARKNSRKAEQGTYFFSGPSLKLTDDTRFHLRIGSRSQMSRSSNYREVLGTS
jgi:hypothetical protein